MDIIGSIDFISGQIPIPLSQNILEYVLIVEKHIEYLQKMAKSMKKFDIAKFDFVCFVSFVLIPVSYLIKLAEIIFVDTNFHYVIIDHSNVYFL